MNNFSCQHTRNFYASNQLTKMNELKSCLFVCLHVHMFASMLHISLLRAMDREVNVLIAPTVSFYLNNYFWRVACLFDLIILG